MTLYLFFFAAFFLAAFFLTAFFLTALFRLTTLLEEPPDVRILLGRCSAQ